jgi:type IV pilus assembly protein PilA
MRRRPTDEDGFTLVELLVVTIIIGILATIAIQVFLEQRRKGFDAAAQSDLRNFAEFEEIYLSDFYGYGTLAELQANEPHVDVSTGVTVTLVHYQSDLGYCLSAKHSGSAVTWYWDSESGGALSKGSTGCLTTTTGPTGGTLSG